MLSLLLACAPGSVLAEPTSCVEASDRVGATACVETVDSEATWNAMSAEGDDDGVVRTVKYLVPVSETQPVPTAYVNTQRYDLHYDFLREAFPDDYGLLQWNDYVAMIIDPERRAYYGGNVMERRVDDEREFDFIVWDDPADPSTAPTYEDVLAAWEALQTRFDLGDVAFSPSSSTQAEWAGQWEAEFSIRWDGRDVR